MTSVAGGLRLGFDFLCHCEEAAGRRGNPYLVQAVIFRNDIVVGTPAADRRLLVLADHGEKLSKMYEKEGNFLMLRLCYNP